MKYKPDDMVLLNGKLYPLNSAFAKIISNKELNSARCNPYDYEAIIWYKNESCIGLLLSAEISRILTKEEEVMIKVMMA